MARDVSGARPWWVPVAWALFVVAVILDTWWPELHHHLLTRIAVIVLGVSSGGVVTWWGWKRRQANTR